MLSVETLVSSLQLAPHPEGGFYRETYRAEQTCLNGTRSIATAIYYLLPAGHVSKLHRLTSDEMWHFYAGNAMTLVQITQAGQLIETTIGPDIQNGQMVQYMVPAGDWFGAYLPEGSTYALMGCTVSPGFDFRDFEMAAQNTLLTAYPQLSDIIKKLT